LDGPAIRAALRSQRRRQERRARRPYPLPPDADAGHGDAVALAATRALLAAQTREEVAAVLRTAVTDLGGAVVTARSAPDALPVDVALGVGEPALVVVDPVSVAGLRLEHQLPGLVQDALAAAARCDEQQLQARRATTDTLTGLGGRAQVGAQLGAASVGDVVCLLDLDGFKQLNDTRGHAAGDEALRRFAQLLQTCLRGRDFCGRYGGDEFVVVLPAMPLPVARARMGEVAQMWGEVDDHGTTVSIGLAVVSQDGGVAALVRADGAMYRAKRLGPGRVEVSEEEAKPL